MTERSEHLRNRFLASLPAAAFERLEPHLQLVDLPTGLVLYEADQLLDTVYLPHDAVVSIVAVMRDGGIAEMATVGREGVAGYSWAEGERTAPGRHVIQLPGRGSRMPLERLQQVVDDSPAAQRLLLRYLEAFLRETMQLAACNALHTVEARCARWILMTEDRVGSPKLRLTQEFLGEMLGVQRTTVSLVARSLERAGLIANRRGQIEVLDRAGLRAASCECYQVIEGNFERLLPRPAG